MDPVAVATLLFSAVNTLLTLRGGARLQRAQHVREDADRVLAALLPLRDGYRLRKTAATGAPDENAVAGLEDALVLAAARLSVVVNAAAAAYVETGRLYVGNDEEHGAEVEEAAFRDLWAAVIAARNANRAWL